MANNSGRARGRPFKPKEPYTQRLRKILEEYPDGSQILREILQNSDDAKSSQQIFILDHNTYSSNKLFEPELVNGYNRTNLKLDRYQGPALLALNNTIFEERDFQSLLKLADSEKRDQFDKIGVMGVGFNSIYHITDSPSFITGDKFVILDPHEWYFGGGVQFDFVEDNLQQRYPDQFAPFVIPSINLSYNDSYDGTIFRYPLRTKQDSIDSDISKKVYSPNEILETFYNFYKNERTNCILFLKYIETITFFELKEGAAEPDFLFTIELTNANEVREQRRLIAENIVPMMNSLTSKQSNKEVVTSYVASFRRQRGISEIPDENSSWLILNYLDDLQETESHFKNKFKKNIADYKFIPNVGLAINLNDLNAVGRLFCFLPLPISTPFSVSVNGYFAPQDCYCQRDKNLVCFIAPIFEQNAKNEEFSKLLKWKTYPEAKMVLKQLESCYDCTSNERPSNLKEVCFAIYEYMNKMYRAGDGVFELLKESLENIPWILCGKTFYCADQIVFKLPHQSKLDSNDFSVVEFPAEYPSKLVSFFKAMGVRDVIGVKDLILIIKDKSMGNLDRELSTNEIKEIIQILEQIATIQQNARKERKPKLQHDSSKTTLLSDEMDDWQGPSIWIYNDAEFSDHDFMALIKLGVGGKSHDNTKIGRFGIGFNSSFHVTDLPSIVSGKYIAFLDPNAKFLPAKKYRGTRFNFIEMEFNKRIPDQCFPYKALEDCGFIKDCSFTKEFKGTLFRLPLRTHKLAEMSEISNRVIEIKDILKIFENVQGSKEMLFLRNIESCSLYHIDKGGQAPQMKWQAQIDNMSESIRDIRKSVIVQEQTYQLEIERTNEDNRKSSEIWLLCNGEQERVKPEFEQFSSEKRLRLSNPPALDGEMFSYLPLSVGTNLGVHLNGNFSLSSARSNILHDFLEADSDDASANELYDKNVPIFLSIFEDSDKFLPVELLQDSIHLERLVRIGLKRQINYNTFIECTQEIILQISNNTGSVRDRAKVLVRYLYEHIDNLRFNNEQWDNILEIKFVPSEAKICYTREHQRDDLERQIENLQQHYSEYEIVALLKRIHKGEIKEVVVTRKLVEWIFEKNGTQLVVLSTDVSAKSSEAGKLAEDLLSIVTAQEDQDTSRQNATYPSLFYARREIETQTLDGNSTIDLQSVSRSSRKEGMNDLLKAYSTNFAAKQMKFKIKFCSKNDRQQSIAVLSKH
ncbi:389_t:CDS:10 [Funneliformis geosporum]|uniref:389_t:CDS:1 n=1 Tax=Funneliformis geosporum TaxID=1117311 RepID=A0A9W4SP48_9GLOM|nr:389_t:CDS:10 [Funneliformis geosporum]